MEHTCTVPANILGSALLRDLLRVHPDVISAVRSLGAVQIDPVCIVAPNHHLVLNCRLPGYSAVNLESAIANKTLLEVYAHERCFVPVEDFPLYWPEMLAARQRHKELYDRYRPQIETILSKIASDGPISIKEVAAEDARNEARWGPRKEATIAFDLLWRGGYLAVTQRQSAMKYYHLLEKVVPREWLDDQATTANLQELRYERYLRSVRLTDAADPYFGFHRSTAPERKAILRQLIERGKVKRLRIDGKVREYFASPDFRWDSKIEDAQLPVLVPPLDNVLWRRTRVEDLWNLRYRWEIYTPPDRRRIGPYAMPLASGGKILGVVDARYSRKDEVLTLQHATPLEGVSLGEFTNNLEEAASKLGEYLRANRIVIVKPSASPV